MLCSFPVLPNAFLIPSSPLSSSLFLIGRENNYSRAKQNPRFKQLFPCSLPSAARRRGRALAGCVRQLIAQEIRVTHCRAVPKLLILNWELRGPGNAPDGNTAPREGPSRDPGAGRAQALIIHPCPMESVSYRDPQEFPLPTDPAQTLGPFLCPVSQDMMAAAFSSFVSSPNKGKQTTASRVRF